jgi:hypothetical protein
MQWKRDSKHAITAVDADLSAWLTATYRKRLVASAVATVQSIVRSARVVVKSADDSRSKRSSTMSELDDLYEQAERRKDKRQKEADSEQGKYWEKNKEYEAAKLGRFVRSNLPQLRKRFKPKFYYEKFDVFVEFKIENRTFLMKLHQGWREENNAMLLYRKEDSAILPIGKIKLPDGNLDYISTDRAKEDEVIFMLKEAMQ